MNILFTGGGGAGSEAIYRLLSTKHKLYFSDANVSNINPIIPSENRYSIPMASDRNFVSDVVKLSTKLSIDLLVPTVDEELYSLSQLNSVNVMTPDTKYISIMLDKFSCSKKLLELGLDVPETILIKNYNSDNWTHFPCIAKPRKGRGSRDVYIIQSQDQIEAYLKITGLKGHNAVLQEKIIGQEYTVLMSSNANEDLCAIVPVKVECKRGITINAIIEYNNSIIKACQDIHSRIPTKGCYNIQLILDENGRVFPFEINPRISTTFCMSLASGVDPIDVYTNNLKTHDLLPFKTGVKLNRYWSNILK
jgi:carbamoyl-phosphate synthase large subunit